MRGVFSFKENRYSDLACERRRAEPEIRGVEFERSECAVGHWERIRITSRSGARSIGRPMGNYNTLHTAPFDSHDKAVADAVAEELAIELSRFADLTGVRVTRILAVGLGNERLTPDAIGPMVCNEVNATLQIQRADTKFFSALDCKELAVLKTDVTAACGMDARETVVGVARQIRPDLIIAIDALTAASAERLGTTIQISDTGILPGGGIGNPTSPISKRTVGVPVIAVGVPTVIDARVFASGNADTPQLFVTPKDVCTLVESAARVIGGAINKAFGIEL